MPLEQTLAEVAPILRASEGTFRFTHPSFQTVLTGKQFADEINSGAISPQDVLTVIEPHIAGKPATSFTDSISGYLNPPFNNMLRYLMKRISDPDSIIEQLCELDPHLAARCIHHCDAALRDNVVGNVVHRLDCMLDSGDKNTIEMAVESLGATRSVYAVKPLKNVLVSKIRGGCYVGDWFGSKKDLFALAQIHSKESLELLFGFMTNPAFFTGRRPPYKYSVLRILEDYMDPAMLSEFLFEQFENRVLYAYWSYQNQGVRKALDVMAKDHIYFAQDKRAMSFIGVLRKSVQDRRVDDLCSYNPDENPTTEEILKPMVAGASASILTNLIEYAYDKNPAEHAYFEAYVGEPIDPEVFVHTLERIRHESEPYLKNRPRNFEEWQVYMARRVLKDVETNVLEQAVDKELRILIEQNEEKLREQYQQLMVNDEEQVGQIYSGGVNTAYAYIKPCLIENVHPPNLVPPTMLELLLCLCAVSAVEA